MRYDENDIENLKYEIKRLKEEKRIDYKRLLEQYNKTEEFLKKNPRNLKKDRRQRKKIKELEIEYLAGFQEGLLRGMILLDDNLTSQVMSKKDNL